VYPVAIIMQLKIHQINISGPTDTLLAGPVGCGLRVGRGSAYKFVTSFIETLEPSTKKLHTHTHTHTHTHLSVLNRNMVGEAQPGVLLDHKFYQRCLFLLW